MAAQPQKSSSPTPLPRGSACLNCKRRKIKCDGIRPICGPCNASRGFDDCEFPSENPSVSQQLEEDIERIEERIKELEQSTSSSRTRNGVELQHPYPRSPTPTAQASSSSSRRRLHLSNNVSPLLLEPNLPSSPRPTRSFTEPSRAVRQNLLASFRHNCVQLGCFMQVELFTAAAMLPLPLGHPYRPAQSLMYAVYLWTAYFSPEYWEEGSKEILLNKALEHVNLDLSGRHPNRTMHVLQAEILLSCYFLMNTDNVSAIIHVNSAVSIAVGTKLHLIGSRRRLEIPYTSPSFIPDPAESVSDVEKVRAFWSVVVLSNILAVLEPSQHSTFYDAQQFVVDTPWPFITCINRNSNVQILQESHATLSRFLDGSSVDGTSTLALLSKSTILLKKSVYWSHDGRNVNEQRQFESLVERFFSSIPPIDRFGSSQCERKSWTISWIITRATTIYLYSASADTDDNSRRKCVSTAIEISLMMKAIKEEDFPSVFPVVGPILNDTCSLLVREITRYESIGSPFFRRESEKLRNSVQFILEAMERLSNTNPSIASSLQRFRDSNPLWI
ncbi:hypothetical protein BDQ17DRAFT_1428942 [Cyathus striatus]|nr:hypothetical protein BDQ17DRAFT_1428942 [Cyathus striatus]